LVDASAFEFSAVIPQREASRVFAEPVRNVRVRLKGQAGQDLEVSSQKVIPAEQETLPSAALGWQAGGDVEVAMTDASGMRAAEPFFEVRALLKPADKVALLHGRSGRIRFALPPEPLLNQWSRKLRQLLQKRYNL
jgi:putative peptide zinc metalloprotease protein